MLSVAAKSVLRDAAGAAGQELTQLASAFVKQDNFNWWNNHYQVSHYVIGCHSLATGEDWLYIKQSCIFNSANAYAGKQEWYNYAPVDAFYWYLDKISLDAGLKNYDNQPASVGLQDTSPETQNGVAQVTSGVSANISGDVSAALGNKEGTIGIGGKIGGGVTISNSTIVSVQDCQVVNQSATRANNAAWSFEFQKCQLTKSFPYPLYAALSDPPRLATTTFKPTDQWIWRVTPAVRAAKPPIHVKFYVSIVSTVPEWGLWSVFPDLKHRYRDWVEEYDIPFEYPPIVP